jgi:multisubunit Na+/H+ antiporter MnhG subunit
MTSVFVAAIVSVYGLVEVGAFAIGASTDWKSPPFPVATTILLVGALIFLIGELYVSSYSYKKIEKNIKFFIKDGKIPDLFSISPFGGIISVYAAYSTILFILIIFVGWTSDDWNIKVTPYPFLNLFIFVIVPIILSWIIAVTLPKKYYNAKLKALADSYQEVLPKKKKGIAKRK